MAGRFKRRNQRMPTYPRYKEARNDSPSTAGERTQYVSAWEDQGQYLATPIVYQEGRNFTGGVNQPFVPMPGEPTTAIPGAPAIQGLIRGPINNWTDAAGHGAILAIDPGTGETKWKFNMTDVTDSGIVTTASDLLITGGREGYLQILDVGTGRCCGNRILGPRSGRIR